jgi:hypothetical protein
MTNTLNMKKDFINRLYTDRFTFNSIEQASNMSNLMNTVSTDIYPDPKRFIVEMIQNCDDSSFQFTDNLKINFTFKDNIIIVSHNGKPFDEEDIRSICSTGASTKINNMKATGYKGLGFKSVFQHSNKVVICSDGYKFRFDKDYFTQEKMWQAEWGKLEIFHNMSTKSLVKQVNKPWQMIPIWTEDSELDNFILTVAKDWNVNFIIYFYQKSSLEECRSFIQETEKDQNYFLFLKSQNITLKLSDEFDEISNVCKSVNNDNIVKISSKDQNINYFYIHQGEDIPIKNLGNEFLTKVTNDQNLPPKLKDLDFNISVNLAVQLDYIQESNSYILKQIPQDKRFIYAFLPTKVNYNFPFLVNSNFILDAGRTQFKENYWNESIFELLPLYIYSFQKELFRRFGNSFVLALPIQFTMSCKLFESAYVNSLENIYAISRDNTVIYTKKAINHPERCFFDQFQLNAMSSIEEYFRHIFGTRGSSVLKAFLSTKNIIYSSEFEIDNNDSQYIDILNFYYKFNIPKITIEDLFEFLSSEIYRMNYSHEHTQRIIYSLKGTPYFSHLKTACFIPNRKNEFKKPEELKILNQNLEVDAFLQDYDNLINEDFLSLFKDEDRSLLEGLGVGVKDINDSIIKQINENNYNKETSIDIVRAVFLKWVRGNDTVKLECITLLLWKKLITENDQFHHPYNIMIGKFYTGENTWERLIDFNISQNYYIQGTEKAQWVIFFSQIGLWIVNKAFLVPLPKEPFRDCPFLPSAFKDEVLKSRHHFTKKVQEIGCYIDIIPFAEELYKYNIEKFFTENIEYLREPSSSGLRHPSNFVNYVKWLIEREKLVPTHKHTAIDYKELYSNQVYESQPQEISEILKNVLDFPFNEVTFKKMTEAGFKFKTINELDAAKAKELLDNLYSFCVSKANSKNKNLGIIKQYFFTIMLRLSQIPNSSYDGYFLNEDDNFSKKEDLFYIVDDHIQTILEDQLKMKRRLTLKLPDENGEAISKFLKFCRNSQIKIYDKGDITYHHTSPVYDPELVTKISQIVEYFNKYSGANLSLAAIKKLKFYSCSGIYFKAYTEEYSHGLCYFDKKENAIFYLKDDVYISWEHPSIQFYIAEFLTNILKIKEKHPHFITLLRLKREEDIMAWLRNKTF